MKNIYILPHSRFDNICESNVWNDNNVESLKDKAFISIICTDDVRKYYLEEDEDETSHWFKENHDNVLNVEFDDCEEIISLDNKYDKFAYPITQEQANDIYKFILDNMGKDFYIHCRAGISRSGAVGRFIYDLDKAMNDNKSNYEFEQINYVRPNITVKQKLMRAYYGEV